MTSPTDTGGPRRGPLAIGPEYTIIGTSGSTDYLLEVDQYRPTRQDRRFWLVSVPSGEPAPDGQTCDGLHDERAPTYYLCTRCFPDVADLRGDLAEPQDDEYADARRDDDQEME